MKVTLTPMQRVVAVAHYMECHDSSMSDREAATCIQGAMEYDGCYADDARDADIMRWCEDVAPIDYALIQWTLCDM